MTRGSSAFITGGSWDSPSAACVVVLDACAGEMQAAERLHATRTTQAAALEAQMQVETTSVLLGRVWCGVIQSSTTGWLECCGLRDPHMDL
jgi:hypothetical protein